MVDSIFILYVIFLVSLTPARVIRMLVEIMVGIGIRNMNSLCQFSCM